MCTPRGERRLINIRLTIFLQNGAYMDNYFLTTDGPADSHSDFSAHTWVVLFRFHGFGAFILVTVGAPRGFGDLGRMVIYF